MGVGGPRHVRGDGRLGDHVEAPNVRGMLGNRSVMRREIVDECRNAWLVALEQLAHRAALAAAVAQHFVPDIERLELRDPARLIFVAEVGEDDDVGDLGDSRQRLDRAPRAPGCYLMKDRAGVIVYVGKARALRARLGQ